MSLSFGGRSLGGRLSARLALQSFVGLTALSLLVFLTIDAHLLGRQSRALDEMQGLVIHLVEEAGAVLEADSLEHALRDQFAGREDARLELVDADGQLLSGATGVAAHGADVPAFSSSHRVRTRIFALPLPPGSEEAPVRARLKLATEPDDALLGRLAWTLASGVVIGTLIVSAAAFWRVRRELAPVERLVTQIDALDVPHLEQRLEGGEQPTELQPLVARFNELLDRLDRAYRQMSAFNADVAHELNTPLATLITGNEIASRGDLDEPASRELIGSNLEELQRLGGIVRDMLFLSTAERGARARTTRVRSLAREAREVLEYHEAVLEEAGLEGAVHGDASAEIDARLVRRALSNLVGNATRYASPGTRIDVHVGYAESARACRHAPVVDDVDVLPRSGSLEPASEREIVRLAVSNRGETVPKAQLPRLFERFYRADEGASSAPPTEAMAGPGGRSTRHGLGLSIVAAVARMHGGTPIATSIDGVTTIGFTLAIASPTRGGAEDAPLGRADVATHRTRDDV